VCDDHGRFSGADTSCCIHVLLCVEPPSLVVRSDCPKAEQNLSQCFTMETSSVSVKELWPT